jgi:hypothetical protein
MVPYILITIGSILLIGGVLLLIRKPAVNETQSRFDEVAIKEKATTSNLADNSSTNKAPKAMTIDEGTISGKESTVSLSAENASTAETSELNQQIVVFFQLVSIPFNS